MWWLLAAGAQAEPDAGWQPFGPERGHVVDVAVGERRVSVATRVEVLTADPDLAQWARDPRFPPDTRCLAYGPKGTGWAASPGQIWRVKREPSLAVDLGDGSHAVDLAVTGEDVLIAAVRGRTQGVWRVVHGDQGLNVERLLPDQDPWRVIAHKDQVWVGTVDGGLWHSANGGLNFEQEMSGVGVTALAWVDGAPWAALHDGRVLNASNGQEITRLSRGWLTSLASAGDRVLATADGPGHVPPLFAIQDGEVTPEPIPDLEPSTSLPRPTGVWSLDQETVLMGTFRLGPFRLDEAGMNPARSGFRSGVTGGAAVDSEGRLIVALMGTGVYERQQDGTWKVQGGSKGPVTDAVNVAALTNGVAVLDFEGVAWRGNSGKWSRLKGVEIPHTGRRNALVDVGVDASGTWWGVDVQQALYQATAEGWKPCSSPPVSRLDGDGERLVAVGSRDFLRLTDCETEPVKALEGLRVSPADSRVVGSWVAAPGQLIRDGVRVASLPVSPVVAVAARGDEILVASGDGSVSLCTADGCESAASSTREPAVAVGWLPDGRLWLAESRGTLLVSGGEGVPPPRSDVALHERPQVDVMSLETAPWTREGVAGNAPATPDEGDVLPSHLKPVAGPGQRDPGQAPDWVASEPSRTAPSAPEREPTRWPWFLVGALVLGGIGMGARHLRRSP